MRVIKTDAVPPVYAEPVMVSPAQEAGIAINLTMEEARHLSALLEATQGDWGRPGPAQTFYTLFRLLYNQGAWGEFVGLRDILIDEARFFPLASD